ncbi:hypothetical protein [Streptomyces sp. NPDC046909]|uniref:hypothetical protein n=1 Tax=Streptomyces sp. NPDC046909 TaxID=3155617 RepID=UPI00340C0A1A
MNSRNNPAPGEGDDASVFPDEVWQQFIQDSERLIRGTASRELPTQQQTATTKSIPFEAVGELWTPEDPWTGPAWRDMDARGRRRRVGRALGTVGALILLLGALSYLPTGSDDQPSTDNEATWTQSEDASEPEQTETACPAAEDSASCTG